MVVELWTFTYELHVGRRRIEAWRSLRGLGRHVQGFRAASAGIDDEITLFADTRFPTDAEFVRVSQSLLTPFGRTTCKYVESGGRSGVVVVRVCITLERAGFDYSAIASMIGDSTPGASERVRLRCRRGR